MVSAHLRINDEHLLGVLRDAYEGVDDVCAQVHGNVFDAVAAHARSVDSPGAEVAYYARFAVC